MHRNLNAKAKEYMGEKSETTFLMSERRTKREKGDCLGVGWPEWRRRKLKIRKKETD